MGCCESRQNNDVKNGRSKQPTAAKTKTKEKTKDIESVPLTSPSTSSSARDEAEPFESRFVKGRELGRGAYSVVFEVSDARTGEKFAAKEVARAGLSAEDELGLRAELRVLARLRHPGVVRLRGCWEDARTVRVVLELLRGGELFDRIVKKSCYSEREARLLVKALLEALQYVHSQDVVHRDLKPENLILVDDSDDANVKIADFGFAAETQGLTLTTQCGSPGYVAPEILENKKYGKPADMWSMGVITYILLGGYPPFHDDKDQASLFRKIKQGQYEFHEDYWSHISPEVKDLIGGLLTVDMHRRLTVEQALQHPWLKISDSELASHDLGTNLKEFKKFHATRKFRAAAKAVIAIRRMSRTFGVNKLEESAGKDSSNKERDNEAERSEGDMRPATEVHEELSKHE